MARSTGSKVLIRPPGVSRQIAFHQLLVAARKTWLRDALDEALAHVDPHEVKAQIEQFAPREAQQTLAAAGIRDEHVFPTPVVLSAKKLFHNPAVTF